MELDISKLHLKNKGIQLLVALLLAVVIVVAGYFAMFKGQYEELKEAERVEAEELKPEYERLSAQAANLDNLKLELAQIEQSTEALIKQLPTEAEIPDLLKELQKAAADSQLSFSLKQQPIEVDGNIKRLPYLLEVKGTYAQISDFVRKIGALSRIVILSDIQLQSASSGNGKNQLIFGGIASTYQAIPIVPDAASAASTAN